MVSNIRKNPDRTEKLGITLPISYCRKSIIIVAISLVADIFVELLRDLLKQNNVESKRYAHLHLQFLTITITTLAAAGSTNTTTLPERRSSNRVCVHVITRKKEGLRRHLLFIIIFATYFSVSE